MTTSKPVLLPSTEYSSHYNNPSEHDAEVLSEFPEQLSERKKAETGRNPYYLHDGPPYANGDVHMGHAVNKVLKDFVSRSQFMRGRASLFRPGWDCHGLPIEWKVQEQYASNGVKYKDVPVLEFRKACRDYAFGWQRKQMESMKTLGVMADWDNPYLTVHNDAYVGTLSALYDMVSKGLVYSAERPVLWSVPEQTAMADAEVEYKNGRFQSLMVRFKVKSVKEPLLENCLVQNDVSVVCWTSTPWSLPGNRMVACASDTYYTVVEVEDVTDSSYVKVGEHFLVAEPLLHDFTEKAGVTEYNTDAGSFLGVMLGSSLVLENPLYKNDVPLVCADFVKDDSGTGFVHVAPSLGPDDFRLAKLHNVEVDQTLDANGCYHKSVPLFAGQAVLKEDGTWGEAQGNVLNYLKDNHMVVALWNDKHSVAYSWRSGAPLLYRATKQWFVNVNKSGLTHDAMKELKNTSFYPTDSRNRLNSMLENRPDWCVSRQRSWGVPMALFVNKKTDEVLADPEVLNRTLNLFAQHGGDCWYSLPDSEFLGKQYSEQDYYKLYDVLDVWFESGATWSWVNNNYLTYGEHKVADLYMEGSDQHRGWFQASLLESVAVQGKTPFKNLFTHGFVLDSKRKKMAKSLGNVVAPQDVLEKYGADVMRWWVASSDVTHDVAYADKAMQANVVVVKKFRNTLRWLLGVCNEGYDPEFKFENLEEEDKWVLASVYHLKDKVVEAYDKFDFPEVACLLRDFCNEELSSLWMNMKKDSFYCDALNSTKRKSAVYTASRLFEAFTSLLSPVLPFLCEQAWKFYPHASEKFAFLTSWDFPEVWNDHDLMKKWEHVRDLRNEASVVMEKLQKAKEVKSLTDMHVSLYGSESLQNVDFGKLLAVASYEYHVADKNNVEVTKAKGHKCVRCWKVLPEVTTEETLCKRCESV